MTVPALFVSAFIIGLSGAMMPGPLLTYVIDRSLRKGFIAGPIIILGHALLELILIVLILLGLNKLLADPAFGSALGIIGGSILLWMGLGMVKSAIYKEISIEDPPAKKRNSTGLILSGALISISNPYWVLWWSTVGLTYLASAYQRGVLATGAFYFGHILADFFWYSLIAWIVVFGRRVLNDRMYRLLILLFGILLIYFGGSFIVNGLGFFFKI